MQRAAETDIITQTPAKFVEGSSDYSGYSRYTSCIIFGCASEFMQVVIVAPPNESLTIFLDRITYNNSLN